MPYMDTIACAILFEASISLAAPGVQMEKLDLNEELKKRVQSLVQRILPKMPSQVWR